MLSSRTRRMAPVVALLASAWVASTTSAQATADFVALDSPRHEVTNFNVETVTGMCWAPDGSGLYAINTHGSRLLKHVDGDGIPDALWTTINNPVAMAIWERTAVEYEVIVLGGATHSLVAHDPLTGAVVRMTNLPSEPGDIVIAPGGRAFVSSMGSNEVLELELSTFDVVRTYDIPSQRPRFLHLVTDAGVPAGYRVFVAPFLSGNNTVVDQATAPSLVRGLPDDDPATPELEGLPDEDLFELVPPAGGSGPGTVAPLVKGLGNLVLEHVLNPATGQYCILSMVAENDDPNRQSEPALKGDFTESGLTLLSLPAQGQAPIVAPAHIDLDDAITGGPKNYGVATSCSFPFAVAVDPITGFIFVASSTNDRIVGLSPNGNRIWQRDLPQGAIPRDLLLDRTTNSLTVYCWGTNELLLLSLFDLNGQGLTLDLGLDPTPDMVALGRDHFYDARNSQDGRTTCASCHPGGGMDGIAWAVSDPPVDRKDAMVTQSLLSIEDTFPYHWRGERQLRDFNRKAFPGLLGGSALVGNDFEAFKEFVFSLQAPRNPGESLARVVDDTLAPPGVSAVQGQTDFHDVDSLFGFSCSGCHSLPEGENGGKSADSPSNFPSDRNFDTPHLRLLYNKEVGSVSVELPTGTEELPSTGWGLSHDGDVFDIEAFIQPPGFTITPQQALDMTAFVRQFDQGIAPAAQLGWLLDGSDDEALASIQQYLVPQAGMDWLDLVAFGTIEDATGSQVSARWLFDPVSGRFRANDSSVQIGERPTGTALLADFQTQALVGTASNTFIGVPPGNGRRFALDPDNDQLNDGVELAFDPPLDPEDPDSDGDGDPDGHELANEGNPANGEVQSNDVTPPFALPGFPEFLDVSTATAEYGLRFSEPVTYSITYQRPGDPALTRSRFHPVVEDTLVLQEMFPSSLEISFGPIFVPRTLSTYTLSMSMTDLGGNTTTTSVAHMPTTDDHIEPTFEPSSTGTFPSAAASITMFVESLSMQPTKLGSTLTGNVSVTVSAMHEGLNAGAVVGLVPQQGHRVVAQILLDTGTGWQIVPATQITIPGGSAGGKAAGYFILGPSGPFAAPLSEIVFTDPTSASGIGTTDFSVSGLNPGDRVRFNIIGLYIDTLLTQGGLPVYRNGDAWQVPNTEDDPGGDPTMSRRGVEVVF